MKPDDAHLALLEADFERLIAERSRSARASRSRKGPGALKSEQQLHERARERRFRQLLDGLPAAVYTTDASGRITFYNQAAVQLWGQRPELGRSEWCGSWRLFWPDGRPMPHHTCPMAVALREDRIVRGLEAVAERPDGTRVPFIPYPTPLHDESGALVGAVNMLVDITERKRAEEQQALLIRELHHRVKNMLATVQALMRSTARGATTIEEFQEIFAGRLESLAKTHACLAEDQAQAIAFMDLLRNELGPYEDAGHPRVELQGPFVKLSSEIAVPLSMAIHELTTNAAKYGALSVQDGSVAVHWTLSAASGRQELAFEWRELNGPAVRAPSRRGFGSDLLERVFAGQIGGTIAIRHDAQGLRAQVTIPLPSARPPSTPMDSLGQA